MIRPTRRRRGRRRLVSAAAAAAAATAAVADGALFSEADSSGGRSNVDAEQAAERKFFDLSDWYEDEIDELRSHAFALQDLGDDFGIRRPLVGVEMESIPDADTEGRRRLLSVEEFLSSAESEWDADFRSAHGRDRNRVTMAANNEESPGGIRRAKRVSFGGNKNRNKVSMRFGGPQPRRDFRCIDEDDTLPLKCPPEDLGRQCDKYNGGTFKECYQSCKPSFCCIHDSLSKSYAPTCAKTQPNCPSYFACYIVWWKLHDTIGPANYLRITQDEPFYDGADFQYVLDDLGDDQEFFRQLFGHHFDTDDAPTDDTFEDPDNW